MVIFPVDASASESPGRHRRDDEAVPAVVELATKKSTSAPAGNK
jgi:hypothetical protein